MWSTPLVLQSVSAAHATINFEEEFEFPIKFIRECLKNFLKNSFYLIRYFVINILDNLNSFNYSTIYENKI